MRLKSIGALVVAGLLTPAANAQLMVFDGASYNLYAEAQAGLDSENLGGGGGVMDAVFSDSAEAYAEESGLGNGYNYARGSGGVSWSVSAHSFSGSAGGVAEGYSEGADTYASGGAWLNLYFTLTADAVFDMTYDGTYESIIYRWNGSDFEQAYNVFGYETFTLSAGSYRWDSSAGETVSGTNYYSSGMNWTADVQAVPEPGTMLALAAGGAILARRRRG